MTETPNREYLKSLLNKTMRIHITDGRVLVGIFLCTDSNSNIVLGLCKEYTNVNALTSETSEPRSIGLSMIPGNHIISMHIDQPI